MPTISTVSDDRETAARRMVLGLEHFDGRGPLILCTGNTAFDPSTCEPHDYRCLVTLARAAADWIPFR